jgi:hypothetical protein
MAFSEGKRLPLGQIILILILIMQILQRTFWEIMPQSHYIFERDKKTQFAIFRHVTKKWQKSSNILISFLTYIEIWQNLHVDDHQPTYFTNL